MRTAEIKGRSGANFVVAAAQEAAHIEQSRRRRSTASPSRTSELFSEAVLNPPPLVPAMERISSGTGVKPHRPGDRTFSFEPLGVSKISLKSPHGEKSPPTGSHIHLRN